MATLPRPPELPLPDITGSNPGRELFVWFEKMYPDLLMDLYYEQDNYRDPNEWGELVGKEVAYVWKEEVGRPLPRNALMAVIEYSADVHEGAETPPTIRDPEGYL